MWQPEARLKCAVLKLPNHHRVASFRSAMDSIPVNSQTPHYYWDLLSLCQDFLQWDHSNSLDYEATEAHNAVMIPGREGAA